MPATQRIIFFDYLRVLLAYLGIVLHTAFYAIVYNLYANHHFNRTFSLQILAWIHSFRMPAFFLIAGFFAKLILQNKGLGSFCLDRLKRIVLPFIVLAIIISGYRVFILSMGNAVLVPQSHTPKPDLATAINYTSYIWFLYYLLVFYVLALIGCGAHRFIKNIMSERSIKWLLLTSLLLLNILSLLGHPSAAAFLPISYTPDLQLMVYYVSFFIVGWLLVGQTAVFAMLKKFAGWLISGACLIYLVFLYLSLGPWHNLLSLEPNYSTVERCYYLFLSWSWVIALMAVFLRYATRKSKIILYLSRSSYWIYLAHYPIVLISLPVIAIYIHNIIIQWAVCFILTTLLCLVSYRPIGRRFTHFFSASKLVSAPK